jgi:hypothetical protein
VWLAANADEPSKKLEWDVATAKATNAPELEPLIRPTYRDGWTV